MTTLIVTRGYSGSGKTTYARQTGAVMVSRDDLRTQLFDTEGKAKLSGEQEAIVTDAQKALARGLLRAGYNVVVHDTNLHHGVYAAWIKLAKAERVSFRGVWFDHVDVETCKQRAVGVPHGVIDRQARKYPVSKWKGLREYDPAHIEPYEEMTNGLQRVIICDLDGTLAHSVFRNIYDLSRVGSDVADFEILQTVKAMKSSGYPIVFMSGRDESCREQTEAWLDMHGFDNAELYMRPAGDTRVDWEVKNELFDKHIAGKYNVLYCLDDREQVVRMWRAKGLKVLQVAEGDF